RTELPRTSRQIRGGPVSVGINRLCKDADSFHQKKNLAERGGSSARWTCLFFRHNSFARAVTARPEGCLRELYSFCSGSLGNGSALISRLVSMLVGILKRAAPSDLPVMQPTTF